MTPGMVMLAVVLAVALLIVLGLWRQRVREAFIRETLLPPGLLDALREPFPALSLKDRQLVARGLRKFFLAQGKAGRQPVAMPSRVVGALWTAFAQRGAAYDTYCRKALGRVLPVTGSVALSEHPENNAALRRCWWHCCREENLDPSAPTRLPLLFALDLKLGIMHGHFYFTDDAARMRHQQRESDRTAAVEPGESAFQIERTWTAADFLDTAFDGSTDGFGDDGGGDGDGGGGD
jgi:hypothetical protein